MSGAANPNPPAGQPSQGQTNPQYYPPPPSGPPPNQQAGQHLNQPHGQYPPQHPNETPIPDYNIPHYDPAHQQFPPPPMAEGIYDHGPVPPQGAAQQHAAAGQAQQPGGAEQHAGGKSSRWSDRLSGWGVKAAAPLNMLANKMGSESFLPTTMDKECEKAARILKSFCKDGVYTDGQAAPGTAPPEPAPQTAPEKHGKHDKKDHGKEKDKAKSRTLLTIPSKVISRAVGLAIFTTGRVGFHVSGATGSGVLIARLPDGSWSPPSGIQVHSVGAGFVIGADIYDCVVVINTKEALEAFTRTRMSLGSDLAVVAGPWGAGGSLDFAAPASDRARSKERDNAAKTETTGQHPAGYPSDKPAEGQAFGGGPAAPGQPQVTTGVNTTTAPAQSSPADLKPGTSKDRKPSPFRQALSKPVYSYVKSRGFYAGVQIDGTVVTERKDANAAFYGSQVPVEQIIKGEVPAGNWHHLAKGLFDVVRGAEGPRSPTTAAPATGAPGTVPTAAPAAGSFAPTAGTGYYSGTAGGPPPPVDATTASMQHMNLGGSAPPAAASATQGQEYYPPPPPMTKEQEAAAESSHARAAQGGPPPPGYTELSHSAEQPPGYVNDGQVRPGVGDQKMPPPPPAQ
ncbi:uncharacterized protein E0L32_007449 [Thyridium curvatum]|uniref:Ysc84 actin-binding domain-containing protein n=1 Tax=Thyridium curvatum TaxID=1093900 RepID=A0A507B4F5_9PEZI|nr:uncharacterized protein E0L32_007449 [Thyridium curvatum]TPX11951.1 hypothetical protein E0L32_007449 [Thyridium curvatum]